jgi:MHS family alpha-ketoglutarate permease-like MFS transporter
MINLLHLGHLSLDLHAISVKGMDPRSAFTMSCIAQVIYLVFLPISGWISDQWGRKISALISLLGIADMLFPLCGG